MEDVGEYNRKGWNALVEKGDQWTAGVDGATIARARDGDWEVVLTPTKPVPREWFGDIAGKDILGLASGGGQQMPIFAAAGARVTCLDASDAQLARDREVAEREGLEIRTVHGFMHDLSAFDDESFDLIFHPCANSFAPEILSVWRECARVMRPGGVLLVGFTKPEEFIFDVAAMERGELIPRNKLPYSDLDLPEEEFAAIAGDAPLVCFSHSWEDQIGGQLAAGFVLTGLFEDEWQDSPASRLFPPFVATRAVKLA